MARMDEKTLFLGLVVVLLVVDFLADPVLLAIDLGLFLVGQIPAIRFPVLTDFLVDLGLIVLDARCLARCQRAVLDALGDAFLLVFLALLDLAFFFVSRKRQR